MKVRYTRAALADLVGIGAYVGAHYPAISTRVRNRIRSVVALIAGHLFIGTATDHPSIRRMTASPYPYLVFYEIGQNEVIVHAVRHAAQQSYAMSDPTSDPVK